MNECNQKRLDDFQRRLDRARRRRYETWRCKCGECGNTIETFWDKNGKGLMSGNYVACGDILLHVNCFSRYLEAFQKALDKVTGDMQSFSSQMAGKVF